MTEQRPIQQTPVGALRFNTDNARLEYFDGNEWIDDIEKLKSLCKIDAK